jgi:hypothetical protein
VPLLDRAKLFFNKLERYIASYTPLRLILYDTISITQKFNIFKTLRRSTTSFGG